MSDQPLEFPPLFDNVASHWEWPVPPFAWRHRPVPGSDVAQPCRIESHTGTVVEGFMLGFDPAAHTLAFRTGSAGPVVTLSFLRFRRLTLLTPLQSAAGGAGASADPVPAAMQERDYSLQMNSNGVPLTGRTAGYVETADGMFLFTPVDEESALLRVFVPRSSYTRSEFGPSAEEAAARRWISSPRELLEAIERQKRSPVLPLGHSLLALGLLTARQLDRELAKPSGKLPLGESLVAAGMISKTDLQTALAHKMGYPLVDLDHFPIDAAAVDRLPEDLAKRFRAMPLMLDKDRLIVAVDRLSREIPLRELRALLQVAVVPVLAPRTKVQQALGRLSGDVWAHHLPDHMGFFATTL